ncbi:hypothetical protein HPB48_014426 [Haemaphysalis longicornis]|uniref:PiggyBac transposable element-derived protein domain-containing protein n=1 Tax=Haemaphysalis longicornis TaxID=44386 RepID=A0A9J6GUD9_HAELO|nr:hypothetical protein HPB48_014426 [Haemaphysalis longicornis]
MESYIGMYLILGLEQMGLVLVPSVSCYCENETRFPVVADVMPRNRFEKLLRFLYFEDNSSVSEDVKRDKIWKLRKWLNAREENLRSVSPE